MMLLCGWRKRNNKRSKSTNRKQSNASTECAINDNGSTVMSSADANPAVAMVNSSDNSTENYSISTFANVLLLVYIFLCICSHFGASGGFFFFLGCSRLREKKKIEFDIQSLWSFGATFLNRCQSYFNLIWVVVSKEQYQHHLKLSQTATHSRKYKLWAISHKSLFFFSEEKKTISCATAILACSQ